MGNISGFSLSGRMPATLPGDLRAPRISERVEKYRTQHDVAHLRAGYFYSPVGVEDGLEFEAMESLETDQDGPGAGQADAHAVAGQGVGVLPACLEMGLG